MGLCEKPVAVLQQAVAVLAEDALVAQLNASLNTSEPVVATTDVSVTVAVKLDMTSTVAHTVQVPNSSVTATVPATVLSQVLSTYKARARPNMRLHTKIKRDNHECVLYFLHFLNICYRCYVFCFHSMCMWFCSDRV